MKPDASLLERLGERVRARRKAWALTLKEVSQKADVSERFLQMVEKGGANISVVKLDAIARALGATASELLADAPAAAEGGVVVALLGVRGAGKSSIGARAAQRLGVPFVELDAVVAARAGLSLAEIFELHGAEYYKRLEREELERLVAAGSGALVATGGSIVTDHATYAFLRQRCCTIWLRAKAEDHMSRVLAQGDVRPMSNREDAMHELEALLRARRALYEQAGFTVDTSAVGFERAVEQVVRIARDARASSV